MSFDTLDMSAELLCAVAEQGAKPAHQDTHRGRGSRGAARRKANSAQ